MDDELDFMGPAVLPGEPTEAVPGSEKKIRVMMERASRREQLFHPEDGIRRKNRFKIRTMRTLFPSESA